MNRFVIGRSATSTTPPALAPRGGTELLALPHGRVWTVGHAAGERAVTESPGEKGVWLMTAGHCLATTAERSAALAAGCRGDLEPALSLPGSHLTLLCTGNETRVFGDGAGVVPLYWLAHDRGVWWATAATPLATLAGATPDLAWLLADLTLAGVDYRLETAHFEGVRRVPPGNALVLRGPAAPDVVPLPAGPTALSLGEGARRLREALTEAVTRRAQATERVTTDLSGGVDSSSVTCLAVRERPTLAITYTDARMAEHDDLLYARRIAAEIGGITHRVIDARDVEVKHFDGLEDPDVLPATDLPSMSLGVLSMLSARLVAVADYGSGAHLTGRGGDNVLGAASSHRVVAFLAGRRLEAFRRASGFARVSRIEPWRAWRQLAATAATSYPCALQRLADRLAEPFPAVWRPAPVDALAWCSATAAARWLTPAGRRAVADLVTSRVPRAAGHTAPGALHDRLDLEWMAGEHATFDAIARQLWGVPIHAPFLDTTVTAACLAIPPFERTRPGVYKPLARIALAHLVPDWLLTRQTKTLFTTSVFDGLAANAPALRRVIAGSQLAASGLLDARQAAADLESGIAGASAPLGALHALIVAELWLARLAATAAHAAWWQPAPEGSIPCP
ncbi:asparagine synthase-related protein [Streptomyces sp. NPDC097640]|uniref:asparagine synthase-related protein n=1 Tax=Streptomyces sp. NPDC097640 TaxID=3157229 RepID=UPI00331E68E1